MGAACTVSSSRSARRAPCASLYLGLMGGVTQARWQRDDQLHLTLRFIGEVDRHRAEDIAAALGAIHHQRFALALANLGQFDRKGRADSLWIGVTPHDQLIALHQKIEQALVRVGFNPETRAFLPHITIARLGRGAGPTDHWLAGSGAISSPSFEIGEFSLYESALGHDGSVYTVAARYPLR